MKEQQLEIKMPAAGRASPKQAGCGDSSYQASDSTKPPRKVHRVLAALCRRSYNRFEAERELHDHCLNSTVSEIQRSYGIRVDRERIEVPGFQGLPTKCCRYWIAPDQRDKAVKVLRHAGLQ